MAVLAVVFLMLTLFEVLEVSFGWGSPPDTAKQDDQALALYMIPTAIVLVAAVGYVTIVLPALHLRRRHRHNPPPRQVDPS